MVIKRLLFFFSVNDTILEYMTYGKNTKHPEQNKQIKTITFGCDHRYSYESKTYGYS